MGWLRRGRMRGGRGHAGGRAGGGRVGAGRAEAGHVGAGVARVVGTPDSFLLHNQPELVAAELVVDQLEVIGDTPVVALAGEGQMGAERASGRHAGGRGGGRVGCGR